MFRTRFVFAFGLSALLLSACAAEDDDDIWMPPTADGKADGVQLLKGHDIPSQFVSATKDYLSARKLQTLVDVGALTGTDLSLAMRADGIIANLPANGRIEAAELARMESNVIFPTLFPEEQAALPHLWDMMQVDSGNAQQVPLAAPSTAFTPELTEPGGLSVPVALTITDLDPAWQTVARRVELVFNGDHNATTIQIADINSVLADPQAFTPAEVETLKLIVVEFNKRATSIEHAKAKVPTPGLTTKHTSLGAGSLDFTANVTLTESRQTYGLTGFGASMTLAVDNHGKLGQGINDKTVMIYVDGAQEYEYRGAQAELPGLGAGTWIVERYNQMGAREDSDKLAIPAFNPGQTTTVVSPYLDYALETASGDPLYKLATAARSSGWEYVDFKWDTTNIPNTAISQQFIDDVATKASILPVGRYQLPYAAVTIDIYPEGVIMASNNSGPIRMLPGADSSGRWVNANVGGYALKLYPSSGAVVSSWGNTMLTAAQRVK